jgi:hypothetical protein
VESLIADEKNPWKSIWTFIGKKMRKAGRTENKPLII